MSRMLRFAGVLALVLSPVAAMAAQVTLTPVADATLYEEANGGLSGGADVGIFVGATGSNGVRRGLVRFDVSAIPVGSTITSATLTLTSSKDAANAAGTSVLAHRTSQAWGEGTVDPGSGGGGGGTSEAGDATWIDAIKGTTTWATAGGDFTAAASATAALGAPLTGAGMVADVAAWVADASTNHGWTLIGDEANTSTAVRYFSRESTGAAPTLFVEYDEPDPCAGGGGAAGPSLVITGVFDGDLTGGNPKAIELLAVNAIADLSAYGFGSANNGGGSDGEEFTFPADAATAGEYIYITASATEFASYFGFAANYISSAASINGDDAVELFHNGAVIDTFGDINTDGTGQPWDYADSWAYRNSGVGGAWDISEWTIPGAGAVDGCNDGAVPNNTNATCSSMWPLGTATVASGSTDGDPCDDGDMCTTMDMCTGGVCGGTAVDCGTGDCAGTCDPASGACGMYPDTTMGCDVDVTTPGVCDGAGVCIDPCDGADCTAEDGACTTGVCAVDTAAAGGFSCSAEPVMDAMACDDGDDCTETDQCTAGVCTGVALDCGTGPCAAACAAGVCSDWPGADTACDNAGEPGVCDGTGTCIDPCATADCTAFDTECMMGQCTVDTSTSEGFSCVGSPRSDATPCDDGDTCTAGDMCAAGVCTGMMVDCGTGPCAGTCTAGACGAYPGAETGCDLGGNPGVCDAAGGCVDPCATADCSAEDSACTVGMCMVNPSAPGGFECMASPLPDTDPCDDGDPCTDNDGCMAGACFGEPVDCGTGPCAGTCDAGTCSAFPGLETTCPAGLCDGAGACIDPCATADCSAGDSDCTTGVCTVDSTAIDGFTCAPEDKPAGTTCTLDCFTTAECAGDTCTGVDAVMCPDNSTCATGTTCECDTDYVDDGNGGCAPTCDPVCGANASCTGVNTCECDAGYEGDGFTCTPNCGATACDANATCTGPDVCECDSGYSGDGITCEPVCTAACGANATCTAPDTCACDDGFTGDGQTCEPVCDPACATNGGTCMAPGMCDCTGVTPCANGGSFDPATCGCDCAAACENGGTQDAACGCDCPPEWTGPTCADDVDECATANGGCAQTCVNSAGSFACECDAGYVLNADGVSCDDVDECATANGGCAQTCVNSAGGFACECDAGYVLSADGLACDDVDECATANGGCAQTCVNSDGTFACLCDAGFVLNADGATCDDIDECATANGNCEQTCVNAVGGFACECAMGYVLSADMVSCADVDECATDNGGCAQTCTNSDGSFECACDDGYVLNADGVACDDVDECADETDDCHPDATCTNVAGSFECECNEGLSGNGTTNCDVVCTPASCNDDNPCTADSCATGGGCAYAPVDGACDDGDACTVVDVCVAGECAGTAKNCDDSNACTDDSCGADGDCVNAEIVCDDDNVCTEDLCATATGCNHPAVDCDDNDACTEDACVAGECELTDVDCDDGDVCTTDSCDASLGCQTEAVEGCCSDTTECAQPPGSCITASCDGETNTCVFAATADCCTNNADCDDGDDTTIDTCETALNACMNAPGCTDDAGCDDGDICTEDGCDTDSGLCSQVVIEGCCTTTDDCDGDDTCEENVCVAPVADDPGGDMPVVEVVEEDPDTTGGDDTTEADTTEADTTDGEDTTGGDDTAGADVGPDASDAGTTAETPPVILSGGSCQGGGGSAPLAWIAVLGLVAVLRRRAAGSAS